MLRDAAYRWLTCSQFAERAGEWLFTITLVALVYRLTGSLASVATLSLAQVAPRVALIAFDIMPSWPSSRGLVLGSAIGRAALIVPMLFVTSRADLPWAAIVVAAFGMLGAAADGARAPLLPALVPRRQIAIVNALNGRVEQASLTGGALLAAVTLGVGGERLALLMAAGLLGIAAACVAGMPISLRVASPARRPLRAAWAMLCERPTLRLLATGLFAGALLGMSLRVILIEVAERRVANVPGVGYALALALFGVGVAAGPLPIPRLLGKASVQAIVTGIVLALAAGAMLVVQTGWVALAAASLPAIGLLAVTNDLVTATMTRRLVPGDQLDGVYRLMAAVVIAGQIAALAAILAIEKRMALGGLALLLATVAGALVLSLFLANGPRAAFAPARRATER